MLKPAYAFRRVNSDVYEFTSDGKKKIEKLVEFSPTDFDGIVNIAFGDLLKEGKIDDEAISNNEDIAKVMATVIQIINDYTIKYPHLKVAFQGSTPARSRFYGWILKTYYKEFSEHFIITCLKEDSMEETAFDADHPFRHSIFLIHRKS